MLARLKPLLSLNRRIAYRKEVLSLISDCSVKLKIAPPTLEEYGQFVREVHDFLVKLDSPLRAMLLRALRLCMATKEHCQCLVDEEVHWVIVVCLEREQEFLVERTQALKLMKRFLACACDAFPPAFARSLVAVANSKDDNMRRVCMEVCLRWPAWKRVVPAESLSHPGTPTLHGS